MSENRGKSKEFRVSDVARRVKPAASWDQLELPQAGMSQLKDICSRVRQCRQLYGQQGIAGDFSRRTGVKALFTGPPGSGKAKAAEVIASELGMHLYKVDLRSLVDKYIGETEKNLARVFAAAERADFVLFFDEADALFGKRTDVRDSHDRYANQEAAFLLQRLETYKGSLAILSSNRQHVIDRAFVRRFDCTIEFPALP